jgi:hypothetical protein
MATRNIVDGTIHVEHGQKLLDVNKELVVRERTNGSEKKK